MINFYSDRTSNTGAHNVSSGIITDLVNNIPQNADNASCTYDSGLSDTPRSSFSPEISEWEKYVIELLKPVVGEDFDIDDAALAAKVKEIYDVELSEKDAGIFGRIIVSEKRSATARNR